MTSNQNVVNNKVVRLEKTKNFHVDHFSIRVHIDCLRSAERETVRPVRRCTFELFLYAPDQTPKSSMSDKVHSFQRLHTISDRDDPKIKVVCFDETHNFRFYHFFI
jgi:hypothetical protein